MEPFALVRTASFLFALSAVMALGCGGSDDGSGDPTARVEALCSEWCTCNGNESESCLDSCKRETTIGSPCKTNDRERYIKCMVEAECSDPTNDCQADGGEDLQNCYAQERANCDTSCAGSQCSPVYSCYELCVRGVSCARYDQCLIYPAENPQYYCGDDCWYYGTAACELR